MKRRNVLPLVLLLVAAGCEAPTAPGERDSLEEARARWLAFGTQSYSYDVNRNCFCLRRSSESGRRRGCPDRSDR